MTEESKKWVEAGKVLGVDPRASVLCPRCEVVGLEVLDVDGKDGLFERHMTCPRCGATNSMRMHRPSP